MYGEQDSLVVVFVFWLCFSLINYFGIKKEASKECCVMKLGTTYICVEDMEQS